MVSKELLRARLAFIRQGSETERYHTKRMLQRNDVGHHSFHVAWLAMLMAAPTLGEAESFALVRAALAHDLAEHITGDMPGDFKRAAGLRSAMGDFERGLFENVGLWFEDQLSPEATRILKLADMMEGCFFCISEASLGNRRVGGVYKNFRHYIGGFAPFTEAESTIVDYIDDLWMHYGRSLATGQSLGDCPGWDKNAHTEYDMDKQDEDPRRPPQGSGLIGALQREEAEGRATPAPHVHDAVIRNKVDGIESCTCGAWRPEGGDWQPPRPQSNAPGPGVTRVPEQAVDDTSDDRATSDLGVDLVDQSHPLPANARQVGGDHYKGSGYEHWDLVLDCGMDYFQGCATKYITRWRKHEAGRLNLEKAMHYVEKVKESEEHNRSGLFGGGAYPVAKVTEYVAANQLNELEGHAIRLILRREWADAYVALTQLLAGATEPEQPQLGRVAYGQVDEQ